VSEPLLSLRGVRKSYTSGEGRQVVLRDLSLEIEGGERVAVLGPSGCGKTTLLNILGGLDRADEGDVRACGVDLAGARRAELTAYRAAKVGFVFQFYNLLPTLTALENVEVGVTIAGVEREQARRRGADLLDRIGLSHATHRFPGQLSGGEQQRVAIVRALAKRPQLLLADEPTGNLDEESAREVLALMSSLVAGSGATLIVVTHDPAVAESCDRIVRLARGAVDGESGTHRPASDDPPQDGAEAVRS